MKHLPQSMTWHWDEFRPIGRDYIRGDEADRYDQTHANFRDMAAETELSLNLLEAGPHTSLLDIGSGTGVFAIAAAQRCRKVIGIDVSDAMLNDRVESHVIATYLCINDRIIVAAKNDALTPSFCCLATFPIKVRQGVSANFEV